MEMIFFKLAVWSKSLLNVVDQSLSRTSQGSAESVVGDQGIFQWQISSGCCTPKINQIGRFSTDMIKNKMEAKGTRVFETHCSSYFAEEGVILSLYSWKPPVNAESSSSLQ